MSDTTDLKAGDVVELKSGGPRMTVSGVEKNNAVCVFFYKQGDIWHGHESRSFLAVALKKVE